ncbi:MAG: phosphotransferase family protein [Acidimicrobiales bacterium]
MSVAEDTVTSLGGQLEALLREVCRDRRLRIAHLRRLTGGASRETWSFDALLSDGTERPLILRRDPPGFVRPRGMATEAASFRAAMDAGVPEPILLVHDDDPTALGAAFIIMERIEGETIARRILREPEYAHARGFLARQCGEILARIHSIERSKIPGLHEPDALATCGAWLEALDEPRPVMELAMRWLLAHRPPASERRTLIHGDFRNGNLVIGPEGVRAVLDWELVHWGDPAEDLGWMCVKAWRFGGDCPVGGFGPYEQLLEGYTSVSEVAVTFETVRWWEVLGTLRWGLGCIAQAHRHLEGTVRSVELAAIGRRTCEQEWDLLKLIGEHS